MIALRAKPFVMSVAQCRVCKHINLKLIIYVRASVQPSFNKTFSVFRELNGIIKQHGVEF